MDSQKENFYRTGAVAKLLGTSQHRIRELARAGVIESQLRNGYRYVPAREVERLTKEGLPPLPANADLDPGGSPGGAEQMDAPLRSTRSRPSPDLYAEPSPKLVRSKEKLVQQQLAADERRVRREMRQSDRAARLEDARARAIEEEQRWRDLHVGHVIDMLPAEACANACARVEYLLNAVPPSMRRLRGGANVGSKVEEIIAESLRPYREREEQAHAQEARRGRIERAVDSIGLPYGATADDYDEARVLGRAALGALPPPTSLPAGASQFAALAVEMAIRRQFIQTLHGAIRAVADRVNQQQVESQRREAEAQRRLHERFINLFKELP
jgi:hypothetical protein